jgi:hypothetical protein
MIKKLLSVEPGEEAEGVCYVAPILQRAPDWSPPTVGA